ncbi:MAG: hypothetical protein AABW99_03780 [archaeon]
MSKKKGRVSDLHKKVMRNMHLEVRKLEKEITRMEKVKIKK